MTINAHAEIRFPGSRKPCFGAIASMSAVGITVLLRSTSRAELRGKAGMPAELVITLRHGAYRADARVTAVENERVTLEFLRPLQPLQRRQHYRLPSALPVMFRAIQPDGRAGAWHVGATKDISIEGMRLAFANCAQLPRSLEVRMKLPEQETPVSAAGRIVHIEQDGNGAVEAGVSLRGISTRDSVLLVNYIDTATQ